MKFPIVLLACPALALCATFSGSVTLLDGTPVSGAVVKVGTDFVVTSGSGSFSLARSAGIASRSGKAVSVTPHLVIENGHPRLSFAGADIMGRARASSSRQIPSGAALRNAASRSAASGDTLCVYWQGKRLTVLPVASDTAVTFRIDTAWKDDAGIPWNPRIAYGSLRDVRDGQTYRTVKIGSQNWMAENLSFSGSTPLIGRCYEDSAKNCLLLGRLYSWAEVMGLDTSFNSKPWSGTSSQGICPEGWHVPSNMEWRTLVPEESSSDTVENGISIHFGGSLTLGGKLKSVSGWTLSGTDEMGFHALRSGMMATGAGGTKWLSGYAYFWASTENISSASTRAWGQLLEDTVNVSAAFSIISKAGGLSLRCLMDP